MFEQSVLDNSRARHSKWSWMGLVIQAGLVTGMLLIPMVSPEILSVVLPQARIYVPRKAPAPVEVEVQPASNTQVASANSVTVVRQPVRFLRAPNAIQPVANIIDAEGHAPPPFITGNVYANTADYAGPTVIGASVLPNAPPPRSPEPAKKDPPVRHRVGGNVQAANIVSRINPIYPPLAKQARISGMVKLEGVIATDGTVQQLKVISGHPLLVPAALAAVKLWRYRPTHLNGDPVEVIAPIDVNFILSN